MSFHAQHMVNPNYMGQFSSCWIQMLALILCKLPSHCILPYGSLLLLHGLNGMLLKVGRMMLILHG